MAMWKPSRGKPLLSRLKTFLALERLNSSFAEAGGRVQFYSNTGKVEFSKWRKLDSRNLGLGRSMISIPSLVVLKTLRAAGLEAYLVGGCVRDLLLNKVPKDFDVITTADLKKVKRKFPRAMIVGQRFPICIVTIKNSTVEVSSFKTESEASKKRQVDYSQMPKGCDPKDFLLWKNCMNRDFTVNSLFFDPLTNVIYDYTNAMMDLRSLKLRTVIPAHLSFKEDTARILRGLRLAARLNLSFSEETEAAINSLSSSVGNISKSRISLEMHYMLSYGAAEPSLLLLRRFKLLEIVLPFHAAYLSEQADNLLSLRSSMLMKLFFNLDQLITCDRPCHDSLWVAMLAFHLALFNNPQHAVVVLTFASLLYHGPWDECVKFARRNALAARIYAPEMLDSSEYLSDDEKIAERVIQFAGQVESSLNILTDPNCPLEEMNRFSKSPKSASVFVTKKTRKLAKHIFRIFTTNDITTLKSKKRSPEIYHSLLTEGNVREIRFVLGKIILDTLAPKTIAAKEVKKLEDKDIPQPLKSLQQVQVHHTSQKLDPVSKYKNEKCMSPSKNEQLTDSAGKSIATDSKNSDPDHVLKDESIKSQSALSGLFR